MCVFMSEGEIYYLAPRQRACRRYECSNLSSKFFQSKYCFVHVRLGLRSYGWEQDPNEYAKNKMTL